MLTKARFGSGTNAPSFRRNEYGRSGRVVTSPSAVRPAVPHSGPATSRPLPANVRPVPKSVDDADFAPVSVLDLKRGERIEHNRFGEGTILEISGDGSGLKAKIDFDSCGTKILLLKYAKIRRMS